MGGIDVLCCKSIVDRSVVDITFDLQLVIDLKENSELRRWLCQHCPKSFAQASNYKTHLKVHGLNTDQIFVCPLCGKDFSYKNSLAIHIATHNSNSSSSEDHVGGRLLQSPLLHCA